MFAKSSCGSSVLRRSVGEAESLSAAFFVEDVWETVSELSLGSAGCLLRLER